FAAVDARMQQAYWAVYDHCDGAWTEMAPPALCEAGALAQLVSAWQVDRCAGNASWLQPYLGDAPVAVHDVAVEGTVMAQLAFGKFMRGELIRAEDALPVYVRDRVAQTVPERRTTSVGEKS
ncbi:MAG TPA: tRNA (adenosine(37)-N6)-threonylcarbamoyltransferase complex dimerization subunit type 1 TsaB, partial [Burkholderiaceae bacterium]|nr:tRNA (adenosine(37)-N6)-threonylcarbamoyltransferase complex dimerization subunit type 1 TsaB [Burkholderiaceae bacterium]